MREEKLLRALNDAEDKFVEEASGDNVSEIKRKLKRLKVKRWVTGSIAACISVIVVCVGLWLFWPYQYYPVTSFQYAYSEYYNVIKYLNPKTYVVNTRYVNNYDFYFGERAPIYTGVRPSGNKMPHTYVETTDNQEFGVIEGDLIKRSDKYAFYIAAIEPSLFYLHIYELDGENTEFLGHYKLPFDDTEVPVEIYLSEDCNTVTAIGGYKAGRKYMTKAISLDVSEPANITEKESISMRGEFVSSRFAEGHFLVATTFTVGKNPDFHDKNSYLPTYNEGDGEKAIPAKNIYIPKNAENTTFIVYNMLEEETLDLADSAAILSSYDGMYISEETIYSVEKFSGRGKTMSEITGLSYSGGDIDYSGSIVIDGDIVNQYSMDEKDGNFLVFTSTRKNTLSGGKRINASFYCISLKEWAVVSKIENFAPDGENVNSVRFQGDKAYVCTSTKNSETADRENREPTQRIPICDPVYIFDLSDLDNVNVKESDELDGFSSSLVQFNDGTFWGIGQDSKGNLKIDVYCEAEQSVVVLHSDVFENTTCSKEYKSYYIDRERGIIGLPVKRIVSSDTVEGYVFLQYTEEGFIELYSLKNMPEYLLDYSRGQYIDGYFYVFRGRVCVVAKDGFEKRIWGDIITK